VAERDVLIERILRAQRELRDQFAEGHAHPLLAVNLTMAQVKVMIVLGRLGGASGQELAKRTGFSLATLTGVVDRLIAQELVSRGEDPRDRRVRRIELTATGTDLVDRLIAAGAAHQGRILRRLDEPSLELVAHAFDLILDAAKTPQPDEAPHPGGG
jgi:DNA-binding MarR family transcriptional regulator